MHTEHGNTVELRDRLFGFGCSVLHLRHGAYENETGQYGQTNINSALQVRGVDVD